MATDLLTASEYYRLAKVYPFKAKFDGEARYITEGRRREKMRLHIAKERFADLKQAKAHATALLNYAAFMGSLSKIVPLSSTAHCTK